MQTLAERQWQREQEEQEERVRNAWVRYWSDEQRRAYYHNMVSGETRWDLPSGAIVQQAPAPEVPDLPELVPSSDEWTEAPTSRYQTMSSGSMYGLQEDGVDCNLRRTAASQEPMMDGVRNIAPDVSAMPSSTVNADANLVSVEEVEAGGESSGGPPTQEQQQDAENVNMWVVRCAPWQGSWYPAYYHRDGGPGRWERPPEMSEETSDRCFVEALRNVEATAPQVQARASEPDNAAGSGENSQKDYFAMLTDGRKLGKSKS